MMVTGRISIDGIPLEKLMIPKNIDHKKIIIPEKSMKKANTDMGWFVEDKK